MEPLQLIHNIHWVAESPHDYLRAAVDGSNRDHILQADRHY